MKKILDTPPKKKIIAILVIFIIAAGGVTAWQWGAISQLWDKPGGDNGALSYEDKVIRQEEYFYNTKFSSCDDDLLLVYSHVMTEHPASSTASQRFVKSSLVKVGNYESSPNCVQILMNNAILNRDVESINRYADMLDELRGRGVKENQDLQVGVTETDHAREVVELIESGKFDSIGEI